MNRRFTITIRESGQEKRVAGSEWAPKADGSAGYEYTPEIEATRPYEREIYSQSVDDVDLAAVIKAVNGLD